MTRKELVLNRKVPDFLQEKNRLDHMKRKPNHPEFDPNTCYISPEEFADLTDGQKRYWDIKKNNMEKIVFWRFGDWYVLYFDDLAVCSKYLDLAITPFLGIP